MGQAMKSVISAARNCSAPRVFRSSTNVGHSLRNRENGTKSGRKEGSRASLGALVKLCKEGCVHEALTVLESRNQQGMCVYDKNIFHQLLQRSIQAKDLGIGREVHGLIIRTGFEENPALGNHLIRMYAVCGSLLEATEVFRNLPTPDVFSWTALITGFVKHGQCEQALKLYEQMQGSSVKPDNYIYVAVIGACATTAALAQGKLIHGHVRESGFGSHVFIGNSLIDMYSKCQSLEDARKVFDSLPSRDLISWNSIIGGYVQQGLNQMAFQLFEQMQEEGILPDRLTFLSILKACCNTQALTQGKLIHAQLLQCGFGSDAFIGTTLIDMYCKCGSLEDARRVFDDVGTRDVALWNAIITGYSQQALGQEAMDLFQQMQAEGLRPNRVTYLSVLKAFSGTAALDLVKVIHSHIRESAFKMDVFLGSTLIDMYAKCRSLQEARSVFERLPARDLVSWTALIRGYVENDNLKESIQLFHQMQQQGLHPDKVTLVSILKACGSAAALDQGMRLHAHVIDQGLEADTIVSNTLIDMYAKCGSLGDARSVFDRLTNKDQASWTVTIAAHCQHGDVQEALRLFHAMQLEGVRPDRITFVCLLSACSHVGSVDEGIRLFQSMSHVCGTVPDMEHYSCMVDLLGRAGYLSEAEELISKMPSEPGVVVLTSLLGACRTHGYVDLGRRSFESILKLDPSNSGAYMLMAHIYAEAGLWDDKAEIMRMMQRACPHKEVGRTWMTFGGEEHSFVVEDTLHSERQQIYAAIEKLVEEIHLLN